MLTSSPVITHHRQSFFLTPLRIMRILQVISLAVLPVVVPVHAEPEECTLPSWTIKDIKIKTRDAVGNGGSASFTLVPSATGKPEQLACARLQGNYRCAVKSQADPGVEVDLQINTGVAHMSVTQLKFPCGSDTYVVFLSPKTHCCAGRSCLYPNEWGGKQKLIPSGRYNRKLIGGSVDIDVECTEPARAGGDISCESAAGGIVQAVLL